MTDSAANFISVIFGIGVFAVIVVVGWRSVQNRRIVRLRDADGQETIIVGREGDDISSVVTTTTETTPAPEPAPSMVAETKGVAHPATAPEFGRGAAKRKTAI